jgi:predicted DNA-binding transcriptional regulator YafY
MAAKDYDKKVFRLLTILNMLNARKRVVPKGLSVDFNVSLRSIQRDLKLLNESGFPIYKDSTGSYVFVEGFNLGQSRLTEKEWALLLSLSDVTAKIGPPFDGLLESIVQKNLHPTAVCDWFYFKIDEPVSVAGIETLLWTLIGAIKDKKLVTFTYTDKVRAKPYKIAHFQGFWYLVAEDTADEVIKKYALDRISEVKTTGKRFSEIPADLGHILDESFNIWFGQKRGKKIVVEVSEDVSHYFRRKKWFPNQEIIEEKDDGNLVVSYVVSNYMEILPFLKSWIPYLWIIRPKELKTRLKRELEAAIKKVAG